MNTKVQRILKNVGWMIATFLLLMLVVSAVEKKQSTNAEAVLIDIQALSNNKYLINQGDVRTMIESSFGYPMEGIPLAILDVERLERVLNEDPFVLDAEAYIDAKNVLKIKVAQREPLLRIIDKNGLNYYLDLEGEKLPLSPHYTARVLVATGNVPPHVPDFNTRKKHLLKDLFELTYILRRDAFLAAQIEQVHISNNGEFTLIPKIGNHRILLGPYEQIEDKLENLMYFYNEILPYKGWEKYKIINLKFKNQVVCK